MIRELEKTLWMRNSYCRLKKPANKQTCQSDTAGHITTGSTRLSTYDTNDTGNVRILESQPKNKTKTST